MAAFAKSQERAKGLAHASCQRLVDKDQTEAASGASVS